MKKFDAKNVYKASQGQPRQRLAFEDTGYFGKSSSSLTTQLVDRVSDFLKSLPGKAGNAFVNLAWTNRGLRGRFASAVAIPAVLALTLANAVSSDQEVEASTPYQSVAQKYNIKADPAYSNLPAVSAARYVPTSVRTTYDNLMKRVSPQRPSADHASASRPSGPSRASAPEHVKEAVAVATKGTLIPQDLVMRFMGRESGFKSSATSDTGACGLAQIMPRTKLWWLYENGDRYGYGDLAQHVQPVHYRNKRGQVTWTNWTVNDRNANREIRSLCRDTSFSATFTVDYLQQNLLAMEKSLGRQLNFTDAYFTHFLGQGGGIRLVEAYDNKHTRKQAAHLHIDPIVLTSPTNRAVFFQNGDRRKPYSVEQVYENVAASQSKTMLPSFTGKYGRSAVASLTLN